MQHEWICDCGGENIPFRQPELPGNDPKSEMNDDRKCPRCGEEMYFDEVPEVGVLIPPNTPRDLRGDSRVTVHADVGRCVSCCGEAHKIIQWTDAGPKQYGAECSICGRRIAGGNPDALIAAFAAANAHALAEERSDDSQQRVVGLPLWEG